MQICTCIDYPFMGEAAMYINVRISMPHVIIQHKSILYELSAAVDVRYL